jgi:hypothetical protein
MPFFWRSKPKPKPLSISGPIGSDRLEAMRSGGQKQVRRVVFAGHGTFNTRTDANYPKVRLPPNVTMVFWCRHGESLINEIAKYVESHENINALPDYLMELARQQGKSTDIPEVVKGGSEIWNYRLTYPSGLQLAKMPERIPHSAYNLPVTPHPNAQAEFPMGVVGDRRYVVMPPITGDIRDRGVPIIALLAGNWNICDGAMVHWCACRSIRDR